MLILNFQISAFARVEDAVEMQSIRTIIRRLSVHHMVFQRKYAKLEIDTPMNIIYNNILLENASEAPIEVIKRIINDAIQAAKVLNISISLSKTYLSINDQLLRKENQAVIHTLKSSIDYLRIHRQHGGILIAQNLVLDQVNAIFARAVQIANEGIYRRIFM